MSRADRNIASPPNDKFTKVLANVWDNVSAVMWSRKHVEQVEVLGIQAETGLRAAIGTVGGVDSWKYKLGKSSQRWPRANYG